MLSIVNPAGGARTPAASPVFATTHWSVVQTARDGDNEESTHALETLCQTYWYPLYAFVRRSGRSPQDAEDLTQGFFARVLEKGYLVTANSAKGTFRSFLLTALKRFMADDWDRANAQKRGGGRALVSLDLEMAEDQFRREPSHNLSPERLFERRWAITVLDRARRRLQEEYTIAGKRDLFDRLRGFYDGDETTLAYGDVALKTGQPVNTVKSNVHRLRKRYRQLVRDEIAQTVSDPMEVENEIRHLLATVSG